jgi:choline dehydrogenase-like flavoprotein
MYMDAGAIEAGTVIDTDICIVGAGAAGITLARNLAGLRKRIVILEGGDREFDPTLNDLYKGANVGLPYFQLDVCQLRALGGNTNGWGGWCRPLDSIDFAPRPWVAESGWPISRAELTKYYRKAHVVCEIDDDDYDIEQWGRRFAAAGGPVLPFDPRLLETTIYQFSPPTRFGRVYAEELRRSLDITCVLRANAVNIATNQAATKVTRIDVARPDGKRFEVRAELFVLAAGGTENARLLLVSRDTIAPGLGNQHDTVGRYFMEHPHTKRRIRPLRRRAPVALYGLKFHGAGVAARISLPAALQEREGLLNYSANIHRIYAGHETAGWMALRKLVLSATRSRRGDPYLRFPPYGPKRVDLTDLWRIAREPAWVAAAGFLQLLQPNGFFTGYQLESKSEQAPNPNSRITLCHERDALGVNRIRLDWRMLPIDRRTVLRGEELIGAELERLGIGQLEPLAPGLEQEWPTNLEGGWHQLGTTRMHADPKKGVVDPKLRLHGVANLYIVGGSVFPTGGAAPPTLTIVALALRLADEIRGVLGFGTAPEPCESTAKQPHLVERELAAAARDGLAPT